MRRNDSKVDRETGMHFANVPVRPLEFRFKFLVLLQLCAICPIIFARTGESLDFTALVPKYEAAVRENESSPAAHMDLGFIYLALAAMDQAALEFEEALRLDAMPVEQYYWLGRLSYLRTKFDDAIPLFQAALQLRAGLGRAVCRVGIVLLSTAPV